MGVMYVFVDMCYVIFLPCSHEFDNPLYEESESM